MCVCVCLGMGVCVFVCLGMGVCVFLSERDFNYFFIATTQRKLFVENYVTAVGKMNTKDSSPNKTQTSISPSLSVILLHIEETILKHN